MDYCPSPFLKQNPLAILNRRCNLQRDNVPLRVCGDYGNLNGISQQGLDMGQWGIFHFDAQLSAMNERKAIDHKNQTIATRG